MAGQRRAQRDLGRLLVANLADHQYVRILAQEGAQGRGVAEVDLGPDLDLVDAFEQHLDRILDGQDLDVGPAQPVDRRIEGGGLAAAGRPGQKDDPVRPVERPLKLVERGFRKAEPLEIERHFAAPEQSQDDALAMRDRRGRDSHVDVAAANREPQPAVLRQPRFGDVEPGHHLDPRRDRRREAVRMPLDFDQPAVDPVADRDRAGHRLDMDVGSAPVHRIGEQALDQADDRRVAVAFSTATRLSSAWSSAFSPMR